QADERGASHCLRRIAFGRPPPPVAQEAVVEVVGYRGADCGGQACHPVPRQLWATGNRRWYSCLGAWQQTSDIELRCGGAVQSVVAIAAEEVPVRAEIMVQAGNAHVVILRDRHVGFEPKHVEAVASASQE